MRYRSFGRTGWEVSEIGCGMWGHGVWDDSITEGLLEEMKFCVDKGVNFFDTAYQYGDGASEKIVGKLLKTCSGKTLYVATKIPPKNNIWPSQQHFLYKDCFPDDHVLSYTESSLKNLGVDCIDLMQFHVWEDAWADNKSWQDMVVRLKEEGLVKAIGISLNRWEPNNGVKTIQTGLVDAVQVVYNIFEQAPEDRLFPFCNELNIAVIARCPFELGVLSGKMTLETKWPESDWRNRIFIPENRIPSVKHADLLKPLVPNGMTMAEMALRFILYNKTVSTVIPGMRKRYQIESNTSCSDGMVLPAELFKKLRQHRWDRAPIWWAS